MNALLKVPKRLPGNAPNHPPVIAELHGNGAAMASWQLLLQLVSEDKLVSENSNEVVVSAGV